jgi:hypothetical protein
MPKSKKFFLKRAEKAELRARAATDAEVAENFASLARAYRSQAGALKARKKSRPKRTDPNGSSAENQAGRNPRNGHSRAAGLLPGLSLQGYGNLTRSRQVSRRCFQLSLACTT